MASSGPSPFKRTMLIDFTLKPTANEPSTWMQLDEQHRFKCGVKDNVKLYDPTSTGRPPSTIYLLSLYPKRKGFVIYQVTRSVCGPEQFSALGSTHTTQSTRFRCR